jgi:hypothetical protein
VVVPVVEMELQLIVLAVLVAVVTLGEELSALKQGTNHNNQAILEHMVLATHLEIQTIQAAQHWIWVRAAVVPVALEEIIVHKMLVLVVLANHTQFLVLL